MVTDSQLVDRLREVLKTADLKTTTTATVRRQLESEFGVDLSEKKQFIRDQVDLYLSELENENKDEEESKEEESGVKEEEESEVEEEAKEVRRTSKRKAPKIKKEVKKGNASGFNKPCSLSPQLEELIGESELARTEVVKRIWAYIRENNLQDPSNRKNILCDEKLQNLFEVKSIDMFQMNKALTKHIWPVPSEEGGSAQKEKKYLITSNDSGGSAQKEKKYLITSNDSGGSVQKENKSASKKKKPSESSDEPQEKKQKVGGFFAPLQISDALAKFIGTGENELTRADAVKRIWAYIKDNNLQNPAEKKTILCDEKMKELFQVDSFTGFGVSKLLAAHLTKKT